MLLPASHLDTLFMVLAGRPKAPSLDFSASSPLGFVALVDADEDVAVLANDHGPVAAVTEDAAPDRPLALDISDHTSAVELGRIMDRMMAAGDAHHAVVSPVMDRETQLIQWWHRESLERSSEAPVRDRPLSDVIVTGAQDRPDADAFNLRLVLDGTWPGAATAALLEAADTITALFGSGLADHVGRDGSQIDDVRVRFDIRPIDGAGGTLAQTRITDLRDATSAHPFLPAEAIITVDVADLDRHVEAWNDIFAHELMHALGFTADVFDRLDLMTADGTFIGERAMQAYGGPVPLELSGGQRIAGSHWSEQRLHPQSGDGGHELMTGWFNPAQRSYATATTVGALADIGYTLAAPDYRGFFPDHDTI